MVQTKMGRYWEQAKRWFFRKVWPFQTEEGRQTKVSKMRPTCKSKENVECKAICCANEKGRVLWDEKPSATFVKRSKKATNSWNND